jgi:hypothetical protein
MATFDAAQITSLAEIFGTTSDEMGYWLDGREGIITDADKTAIVAQIARYVNGTVKGRVWFEGTESNEGFNMGTVNVASNKDPKTIIGGLIGWPQSSGSRLVRA